MTNHNHWEAYNVVKCVLFATVNVAFLVIGIVLFKSKTSTYG